MDISKLTPAERKRIVDAWNRPFGTPRPVPKSEPKKRGRKPKEPTETEEE
jgi:hypothetical protein